jgi:pyruvate formate lyase activating enzyme
MSDSTRGVIFEIQRFSIHDGPGIRTTVFLKGCPLSCRWCHNPESQDAKPEVFFTANKCIGCLFCVRICERKCHRIENKVHIYDRRACLRCGACAKECSPQALEMAGREMTVEDVIAEVRKDQPFYDHSGGGMTVSGGEPTMQFAFTKELLETAKRAGLHTCLETCAYAAKEKVLKLQPLTDLFLYDIKETDSARHREYTGVPNEKILANLSALSAAGAAIVLRCAIVPGFNDRPDHFAAVAKLADSLKGVQAVEVLPYHPLGISKSQRLGKTPSLANVQSPTDETVRDWIAAIQAGTSKPVRQN